MYSKKYKWGVSVPPLVWVCLSLLVPYLFLLCYSFWSVESSQIVKSWDLANYAHFFKNPMYGDVLLRSIKIAATVTALALLIGYPLAYYISFYTRARKDMLYQMVIIPLWVSYLVRGYAWKTILGSDGVVNGLLQYLGITHEPVGFLLYSPFAVVITLTHIYTPFVFLPVFSTLEHIPRNLVEASRDLGATPFRTFLKVILPLSLPGVVAGGVFAFVLSLGDFLAPLLVGGSSGIMISNIVVSLFGAAYNWPLGAAIAFIIMALVITLLYLTEHLEKRMKGATR
jgi:spermidine/putrescine transport system permease protein